MHTSPQLNTTEIMELMFITLCLVFSFASLFVFSLLYSNKNHSSSSLHKSWPVFGVIPSIFSNVHRLLDFLTQVLNQNEGTILCKGLWLCKMEFLVTADPNNVHYIMSKCQQNFHRGDDFNQIFDVLGDGIFNSDDDKWKYQRKIALSTFTSAGFRQSNMKITKEKVYESLLPLLKSACEKGLVIDLQDIFRDLISGITLTVLIGHDLKSLSFDLQNVNRLVLETEEAVFLRHILPEGVWKLQRWLRCGKERKICELKEYVDSFFCEFMPKKREEVMKRMEEDCVETDLVSLYIAQNYDQGHGFESPDIFLKDTFLNFLIAGQDTITSVLTWFFWLLIQHPDIEKKIREELIESKIAKGFDISQLVDSNKLVYLNASLLETLRLYPPVPFNHRTSKKEEVLPSGHRVRPWTKIILVAYALGRMKSVWGEDCEEFKPERWITEQGTIKQEPSHKFFAFNCGPRICIGKEMSMMRLKAVVCNVLCHNYRFEVVEGHQVELNSSSVVFQMTHGLKVKVYKFDD